jgi:hypothetical protein
MTMHFSLIAASCSDRAPDDSELTVNDSAPRTKVVFSLGSSRRPFDPSLKAKPAEQI